MGGLLPSLRRSLGDGEGFILLEPSYELVRFVAREPASGLALGEPHRAASILEIAMSCRLDERKQFLYLPRRGRRAGLLAKRHFRFPRR